MEADLIYTWVLFSNVLPHGFRLLFLTSSKNVLMYIPQKRNEYPKLRKSGEKQVEHFLKGLGLPKFELKIVALNFTIKTTWKWVSMYYDVRC